MSLLATSIAEERYELAALCLLLGFLEAVAKLPPDALSGLLELLEGDAVGSKGR